MVMEDWVGQGAVRYERARLAASSTPFVAMCKICILMGFGLPSSRVLDCLCHLLVPCLATMVEARTGQVFVCEAVMVIKEATYVVRMAWCASSVTFKLSCDNPATFQSRTISARIICSWFAPSARYLDTTPWMERICRTSGYRPYAVMSLNSVIHKLTTFLCDNRQQTPRTLVGHSPSPLVVVCHVTRMKVYFSIKFAVGTLLLHQQHPLQFPSTLHSSKLHLIVCHGNMGMFTHKQLCPSDIGKIFGSLSHFPFQVRQSCFIQEGDAEASTRVKFSRQPATSTPHFVFSGHIIKYPTHGPPLIDAHSFDHPSLVASVSTSPLALPPIPHNDAISGSRIIDCTATSILHLART
ncbi:hypothetical protein QBC45DRAFT_92381 [Copromyces sp. CBS 386.78]|nr:hypothetical protein QBC45DRAFT_92381 [Copromyces sp. CBS 386.78]